jgi:hypothetical protein
MFGIIGAEGLKIAIEDIESREESPAFAAVWLVLSFFRMAK